jgi:hypothetical protein
LLFGGIQQDLHPFEVFGDRDATMMVGSLARCFNFWYNWRDRFELSGCILLQRLEHDGIGHQLVGVELFGLATVEAPEHLFHLVLKGGRLPLEGFVLSDKFPDLGILLRNEFQGLWKC